MKLAEVTKVVLPSILPRWMMSCWSSVKGNTTHEPRPANNETGYSLTEVMASITILAIAIIPMVSMFDTGLKAASASGDYDKARALANIVLEEAKSLSYEEVRDGFPATSTTPDSSGSYADSFRRSYTGAGGDDFAGFEYEVDKRYLKRSPTGSVTEPASATQNFTESTEDEGLIKLTITVRWGDAKTYTATGLVADGLS